MKNDILKSPALYVEKLSLSNYALLLVVLLLLLLIIELLVGIPAVVRSVKK